MKLKSAFFGLVVALFMGCAGQEVKEEKVVEKVEPKKTVMFEAHKDGRMYFFDDFALYQDFLKNGHTAYMKTFIGEGPHGETLVFGLTGKQKKILNGIPHVDLYYGKTQPEGEFYGEMFMDGRYHVFSDMADMTATRKVGEAIFRYTQIGTGPKGETVVYVLNKANKKQRPEALVAKFKEMHGIK